MNGNQTVQNGGLNIDMNRLFDTVNTMANIGRGLGDAWSNAGNNNNQPNNQQMFYDPNSRIMNQNPYNMNPYAQQNPYANAQNTYQPANYGYGYGNVGNTDYSWNEYSNGNYPGISNPGYGM